MKEREHLEDRDLDGMIILKWILNKGVVDYIYLAQDRNKRPALVNAVMNFGFHTMRGIS